MSFFIKKINFIFFTILFLGFGYIFYSTSFNLSPVNAQVNVDEAERRLREELAKLEEQQAILEASLREQKTKTASIQRDVNILNDQIRQAELNIRRKNLEIENLKGNILVKEGTVSELNNKMEKSKNALAQLIRQSNKASNTSLVEILLIHDNLSDFFTDVDSISNIQIQLDELFYQTLDIKNQTEDEKERLAAQQRKELDLKKEIENQKGVVAVKKNEQDTLLNISKKSESAYEQFISEKRAQASAIRTALFQLRDGAGIPFGEALRYAEAASRATGVRTALILAILKQESDLGKSLGSCVIVDLASGRTRGINSGTVFNNGIHPTRDLPLLQTIVRDLGKDPLQTRVSCPFGGGYGGAMGPSQFIPSTWNMYIARLKQIFGIHPDPWNPQHSIMATGLLMRDNGAAAGGYTAERTAALKYYAGGNWNLPQNAFYGNSVLAHATEFQRQIDFLAEVE
ncbi:MAG TPA: lytic murein transglycosylase [Candidatus Paceibacterota bacterium]|nr:lytic murein transglycosylase [Candidatus Paceibacterota bacterium]HMP19072.1 lytic murein transglycosylase [Candidatus Paceibacterota bacterium]HMP85422.1 lytic murein transglycosylase [Candidatus Paceibacterota bacterium]